MRIVLALLLAFIGGNAAAQTVTQSGSVTPGTAARWVTNGVIGTAGTAANPQITSFGILANGNSSFCINSAASSAAGRNQFCLGTTTNGGARISSYAFGSATDATITFDINGTVQGFPTVQTLPVTVDDAVCFATTGGELKSCAGSGGNTDIPIFTTVAAVNASNIGATTLVIATEAYYANGQNSGATYSYYGLVVPSFGCYITSNSGTKYWVPINQTINDKMCGAKVDGVTDDTSFIQGMGTFVAAARPTQIVFTRGTRVISGSVNLWTIADQDNYNILWEDAVFSITANQTGLLPILFAFSNVQNITMNGNVLFQGNLTRADIIATASASGNIGIRCTNNCSGFNNYGTIEGNGILEPISIYRRPAIGVDTTLAPLIGSGGTAYTNGDTLTLPAAIVVGGTVVQTYTATVLAGAVTALTPINTDSYYPFNASEVASWPTPTNAQTGVALTGGTGSGVTINPYARDADPSTQSNGGSLGNIVCNTTYYCFDMQYNGNYFTVNLSKSDTTYRNGFLYGVKGVTVNVEATNYHNDALVVGSYNGLPTVDVSANLTHKPFTDTGILASGNDIRLVFQSGAGQLYNVRLNSNVSYGTAANRGGSVWVVQRQASNGFDATYPRGNIFQGFYWSGVVTGVGDVDGGAGVAAYAGTDLNVTTGWTGDKLSSFVFDNLTLGNPDGTDGFVFLDSRAFAGGMGLSIGPGVQSLGQISYTAGLGAAYSTPAAPTYVDPASSFSNKYAAGTLAAYQAPTSYLGSQAFYGTTSGVVTYQLQAAAGTYNWNWPTTAGTSGQVLTSQGGAATAMTWTTPTTGTVTSVGLTMPAVFSVGGSPVTSSGTLAVTANGTSGGIPYFNATTTMASSAALAANQLVLGGGAGTAPATLGSLGTTSTVLHGNAAGAPTFGAVVSADLNITPTTCTNQFITAISAAAAGTCTTATLASAQFANQGTTTTVLHGNGAGNPAFAQVNLTNTVTGTLPLANGGLGNVGAWAAYTPTVSCGSGAATPTSYTAAGRWYQFGKTTFFAAVVSITTNGACATYLGVTLPAAANATTTFVGRDAGSTGQMWGATVAGGNSILAMVNYAGAYTAVDGSSVSVAGSFEAQ